MSFHKRVLTIFIAMQVAWRIFSHQRSKQINRFVLSALRVVVTPFVQVCKIKIIANRDLKHFRLPIVIFVMMLTVSCGGGGPSQQSTIVPPPPAPIPDPDPGDDPAPELIPPNFPVPRGIISHSGNRVAIPDEILANPIVTGFLVLDGWKAIEPSEGNYDWSFIDSEVARATEAGKIVRLALHIGGDDTPDWVTTNYPDIKTIFNYDSRTGVKFWFPAYWDPTYLEIKTNFYRVLGERYKDSEAVFAISVSMADPNTGDWSFRIDDEEQYQNILEAGFTEEVFIAAHKRIIDTGMESFHNKYVITAVGGLPNLLISRGHTPDRSAAVSQVLDYAFTTYGDRLIIAKGSLQANTPNPNELLVDDSVDPSVLNDWEYLWNYKSHGAGQFNWSFTGDVQYKMNGGTPYTEDEIPLLFDKILERVNAYELNWVEPWRDDLLNEDLSEMFTTLAVEFKLEEMLRVATISKEN